jgi:outer membrane protein assembly factor BamD
MGSRRRALPAARRRKGAVERPYPGPRLAAVNHAQHAVAEYPQAPAAEEALFIMMRAYEALGVEDLRADAERVMRRNFPESAYFKGPVKRDVSWWRIWDPDW